MSVEAETKPYLDYSFCLFFPLLVLECTWSSVEVGKDVEDVANFELGGGEMMQDIGGIDFAGEEAGELNLDDVENNQVGKEFLLMSLQFLPK